MLALSMILSSGAYSFTVGSYLVMTVSVHPLSYAYSQSITRCCVYFSVDEVSMFVSDLHIIS